MFLYFPSNYPQEKLFPIRDIYHFLSLLSSKNTVKFSAIFQLLIFIKEHISNSVLPPNNTNKVVLVIFTTFDFSQRYY